MCIRSHYWVLKLFLYGKNFIKICTFVFHHEDTLYLHFLGFSCFYIYGVFLHHVFPCVGISLVLQWGLVPLLLTTLNCAVSHSNLIIWLNSQYIKVHHYALVTDWFMSIWIRIWCIRHSHFVEIKMTFYLLLAHSFNVVVKVNLPLKAYLYYFSRRQSVPGRTSTN